jgi:penicillin-binding protein 1A
MAMKPKKSSKVIAQRTHPGRGGIVALFFKVLIGAVLICLVLGVAAGFGIYNYLNEDLPQISDLTDYQPPIISTIYSDDNHTIGEFYEERRVVVGLDEIPEVLKQAFIAAEDARFYKHKGIDVFSIVRAFIKNIEAGTIVQGGSTITQQVTKSFFLTPERSYTRKVKEAILAYRIDKTFSKNEILFLYLNQIYLGHGAYGVQAAAENYFGKDIQDLTLAECAIMAGLPQAPSRYSPFREPEKARQRQIYVLNRMVAEGFITDVEATEAINEKLDIKPRRNWFIEAVPFFTEYVRQYAEEKYGKEALYRGGLQVYTTVNIEMQKVAREEINRGLADLDKRQGYRGPVQHLAAEEIEPFIADLENDIATRGMLEPGRVVKGVVTAVNDKKLRVTVALGQSEGTMELKDMSWARKPNPKVNPEQHRVKKPGKVLRAGDVIDVRLMEWREKSADWRLALEQQPLAQSALLCMESDTGFVKAMVGGRDYRQNQFNRAIQSRRQPGSAFKPIVYAAALDKGYTPATVVVDTPIIYKDKSRNKTWKPKNYSKKWSGRILLRNALTKSLNVVTVKILQDIGVGYTIEYARRLGITSELSRDLSIALGSSGVSLLEIVRAYSAFNNFGYLVQPLFITKIVDRHGNVLEDNSPSREKVIEPETAYIMTSLLEGVVQEGTGRKVKALNRPAAGKTGTTNDLYDAWFVGYTPRYVTGAWVGFDNATSLGWRETGSKAASPIWLGFMQRILEGEPVRTFQVPDGVVFAKIDAETGLLPIAESQKTKFECFKDGTAPTDYTPKPGTITQPDQFYKKLM